MAAKVSDTDKGYAKLVERVFGLHTKARIDVGVLDGDAPHGAVTMGELAAWMEFGTETIPERSFIRAWFDAAEPHLREDLRKLMESVVAGKRTKEEALELLGMRAVGQIQERISAGVPPENAPSTIAKKGSATPLIDSGALRSSINFRVEND